MKIDFARLLRSLNFGYKFYTYCRTKNERKKIRVCRYTLIACRWRNPWVSHRFLKYNTQWLTDQLISRPCPKQCTLFRSLYLYNAKNITIFRYGRCIIYAPCFTQHLCTCHSSNPTICILSNLDMNGVILTTFSLNAKIHLFYLLGSEVNE